MTTDSGFSEVPYPVARTDNVWMPGDIDEGDYFRRRGYLDAARMLIHACDNRSGEHLLLPALGSYRQYFELQLKELARIGRAIRADAGQDGRGHRLDLADITATLTHVNVVEGRSEQQAKAHARRDLAKLKAAIDELNRLDPAAVAFRYSYHVAKDGTRTPTSCRASGLTCPSRSRYWKPGRPSPKAPTPSWTCGARTTPTTSRTWLSLKPSTRPSTPTW